MHGLEDVKTAQEARDFYREVVRNIDPGLIRQIEAKPEEASTDSDKTRIAKAAYRKLKTFGPGAVERRRYPALV